MTEEERPLVTFALFAYNQEEYVRDAVEGALAQNYSPLEIILSDDCSTDQTFEIMQDIVKRYEGPHTIILNKNTKNEGIATHINLVMKMIRSKFAVVAAGDDISLPSRTDKCVSTWINSEYKMKSIHSYVEDMSLNGKRNGQLRRGSKDIYLSDPAEHAKKNLFVLGAAHAWDMSIIRNFQPLLKSIVNEDVVIPARASLVGEVGFIPEVLVYYRVGVGVSHEAINHLRTGSSEIPIRLLKQLYYSYLQKFRDYKECDRLDIYHSTFRKARAEALFPIWLRIGHRSGRKLSLFLYRCSITYLLWGFLKYKLPNLVALKQRIQFAIRL